MTWLSKLFGKTSDKIDLSDEDSNDKMSYKLRKKSNRHKSIVMRQKMHKKIAESAKDIVDKRRLKVNSLDRHFKKDHSNLVQNNSKIDFRDELIRGNKTNLVNKLDNLDRLNDEQLSKNEELNSIEVNIDKISVNDNQNGLVL